jgi:hypothetical protein
MKAKKPHGPTTSAAKTAEFRHGSPGSARQRLSRIRAAIKANRDVLRRLAE